MSWVELEKRFTYRIIRQCDSVQAFQSKLKMFTLTQLVLYSEEFTPHTWYQYLQSQSQWTSQPEHFFSLTISSFCFYHAVCLPFYSDSSLLCFSFSKSRDWGHRVYRLLHRLSLQIMICHLTDKLLYIFHTYQWHTNKYTFKKVIRFYKIVK